MICPGNSKLNDGMIKAAFNIALLAAFFWMACPPANADWINLSGAQNAPNIAEIHINDHYVKVELEIFVNDLVAFDRLIPDEFFEGSKKAYATVFQRGSANH
jgi:hypothetical protein